MSSVPRNKQELVETIRTTYTKLRNEFDDIPSLPAQEKTMEGQIKDTQMSVHDLLAYLVGWGGLVLKWDRVYVKENRIPDLPDTGYSMNDWGALAEKFYIEYKDEKYDTLLQKFDQVVDALLSMLNTKTEKELYEADWYITKSSAKGYSFGRMVQLNTCSPYKNARNRLRRWKKEKKLL